MLYLHAIFNLMKKILVLFFCLIFQNILTAQIHEIGVFLGGSNYIGDVGKPTMFLQTSWLLVFYINGTKAQDILIGFPIRNRPFLVTTPIRMFLEEYKEAIVLKII